jgi:hypothetical protein
MIFVLLNLLDIPFFPVGKRVHSGSFSICSLENETVYSICLPKLSSKNKVQLLPVVAQGLIGQHKIVGSNVLKPVYRDSLPL